MAGLWPEGRAKSEETYLDNLRWAADHVQIDDVLDRRRVVRPHGGLRSRVVGSSAAGAEQRRQRR